MASNKFGEFFQVTTWGESHGQSIGLVIDGCPSGLKLSDTEINEALSHRRPGYRKGVSGRKEPDRAQILSGVFKGKTTGAPISIQIKNCDIKSHDYKQIKSIDRPGHAEFTYRQKYGVFDYRGGGRSSARETACRVAAGAVAQKLLDQEGIECLSFLSQAGNVLDKTPIHEIISQDQIFKDPFFCADPNVSVDVGQLIDAMQDKGDSIGGTVTFEIRSAPVGLGDPIYKKLDALLAFAMLSIPATKAFEIGRGFESLYLTGSENNDLYEWKNSEVKPVSNNSGGLLGGISTGEPIYGKVVFKPPSSIALSQETVTVKGEKKNLQIKGSARHDPIVAVRGVPVVRAMCQIVLADALLLHRAYLKY